MTCIVGIEHGGRVLLAGDIQGTGHNSKVVHTQPKVFSKKGVIFGFTSSYRFGQLLEHGLQDPVVPEDDIYRWLVTVLIPDIRNVLKSNDVQGGNCLIGIKDELWEMQGDYSVLRSVKGYAAVGSGSEYAMGSLMTSVNGCLGNYADHEKALKMAIRAAGAFSPSVGSDSVVIST